MTVEADIEKLIVQEQRLRLPSFSPAIAWELGSLLKSRAEEKGLALAIDVRMPQRLLFHFAMDGTLPDNFEWVRRKSNLVFRMLKSSYRVAREYTKRGVVIGPDRGLDAMDYVAAGGSFPISLPGVDVIGAITVSGLPQRDDHNFVVACLCEYLKQPLTELELGPE